MPRLHTNPRAPRPRAGRIARGLTSVELACTLAVLAVATGAALPQYGNWRDDTALAGLASQVEAQVNLARHQSLLRGEPVRLTVTDAVPGSCLMLHTGAAEDCRCQAGQAPRCEGDAELLHATVVASQQRAQLRSNVPSILFDADRGTSTPTGTLRIEAPTGRTVHAIVNLMGRVRLCSPAGRVAGYRSC